MSVANLFLSFQGRISRSQYWRGTFGFWLISILIIFIIIQLSAFGARIVLYAVAGLFCIFWLWTALALAVKRLHDRNKSGHWLWVFSVLPLPATALEEMVRSHNVFVALAFSLASAALGLWGLIEIGFLPGSVNDNKYGQDPSLK